MTLPFIICACITAISAIVSLGFSVAAVLNTDDEANTMALYACARSIALVAVSASPFFYWFDPVAPGSRLQHDHRSGL